MRASLAASQRAHGRARGMRENRRPHTRLSLSECPQCGVARRWCPPRAACATHSRVAPLAHSISHSQTCWLIREAAHQGRGAGGNVQGGAGHLRIGSLAQRKPIAQWLRIAVIFGLALVQRSTPGTAAHSLALVVSSAAGLQILSVRCLELWWACAGIPRRTNSYTYTV